SGYFTSSASRVLAGSARVRVEGSGTTCRRRPATTRRARVRIGLISDTHGRLAPEVVERLAGVERILHAGDVGGPEILDELAAIAPVDAVWGNTDGFALRAVTRESVELDLGGLRFGMAHGHRAGAFD